MRPRLDRPVIRGLSTPAASLTLEFADGREVLVASDAFSAAVAEVRVVSVEFGLGTFLIVSERRARGSRYWVARAYHDGQRASFYLGRSFGEADVRKAAAALAERLGAVRTPPAATSVEEVIRDLLERERDPARRAAAEAIAAMVQRGSRDARRGT